MYRMTKTLIHKEVIHKKTNWKYHNTIEENSDITENEGKVDENDEESAN
jgi:hypothetical protein